jgi:hypothetical protein
MKNLFLSALAILALGVSSQAFAGNDQDQQPVQSEAQPLFTCGLTFHAHGGGLQILIGFFELKGTGTLSCVDVKGNTQEIPVAVRLGGKPLAAQIAIVPFMAIQGAATGIGLSTAPSTLIGHYAIADASAAILIGGTGDVAVRAADSALTFNLGLALTEGLGIQAGLTTLDIEAL